MSTLSDDEIQEALYEEHPIIAGIQLRAYNKASTLKMGRIIRWLSAPGVHPVDPRVLDEEIIYAFIYLTMAPAGRVLRHTLEFEDYLIDKEEFLSTLRDEDLKAATLWFRRVTDLMAATRFEVESKPGAVNRESPPPN